MMNKINTLSLFSGAGGLDIGFHQAGFNLVACVEIESNYCKTLIRNKAKFFGNDCVIHNEDIRLFDPTSYANIGIECVIGGPPCQTFSAAGRRAGGVIGTKDLRGQLYESYCKILDTIKPKVFVFENVYGLPGADGGSAWKEIVSAFAKHGYNLHSEVIDAADYGVPQHRERLILVGSKDSEYKFPLPLVGPDSPSGKPFVSVLDVIHDLQSEEEPYSKGLGGLYGHLLPEVPEGLNYAFFTAEMGHPEPVFAWRSKFHDLLYKVNRNQPCRTIKANPGKFTGPLHWKNRHFTVDELKRLQTFPDNYEIIGSYGRVLEQVGNSVPPKLANCIAESVKEQILLRLEMSEYKYPVRGPNFASTFRQRQRERSKEFKQIAQKVIKERYGNLTDYDNDSIKPKTVKYYVHRPDAFSRAVSSKSIGNKKKHSKIILTEAGPHLRMDLDEVVQNKTSALEFKIHIEGLRKYLPKFDRFTLSANLTDVADIFGCWKEVETCLVGKSKFFTLIDIYGHYANRGDVVKITSEIIMKRKRKLLKMIEYFSQTQNCGEFFDEKIIIDRFNFSPGDLERFVSSLRALRFDIRTSRTHPIIGKGKMICTYPFPLLSPKALVTSKAKLVGNF